MSFDVFVAFIDSALNFPYASVKFEVVFLAFFFFKFVISIWVGGGG
jgi:hypothetical protein